MEFLRLLEEIRTGWLNGIMLAVTYLGSEIIFLAVALIFFWCVDKTRGYYLMSVGFVGTILNQFLKLYCRIPRPWVQDPQFTIVEEASGQGASRWGKLKSGAGWISLDYARRI